MIWVVSLYSNIFSMLSRAQHRIDLLEQIETAGIPGRTRNIEEEERVELEGYSIFIHSPKPLVFSANPLDGCLHVFLSAGSSSALPIRKLYEPDNFPLSPTQAIYEKMFGKPDQRNEKEICSVKCKTLKLLTANIYLFPRLFLIQIPPVPWRKYLRHTQPVVSECL